MPQEQGYEAQTAPREAPLIPARSAAGFGANFGVAMAQVGDDMHRRQVQAYEAERKLNADREAADFANRFAAHRQNMDGVVTQMRSNAGPGGQGHGEGVRKANDAARDALLAGITEDSVRQRALVQFNDYTTRLSDAEGTFEEGQRVAKRLTDHVERRDIAANRIRRGVSPDAYAEELRLGLDDIELAAGLTADQKQKLSRDLEQSYGVAFVQNLQDTNPRAARALIDAGQFDHLGPDVLEQLRNGTDVEIRRAEAAGAHEAALARGQYTEAVATVTERASQGIDVSADLPGLITTAEGMGDTSNAEKLRGLQRDSAFARVWGGASPLQRQARLQALLAKPEGERTANEQAEIKWQQDKGGGLTAAFNADPVGFAIAHGPEAQKPPALNFDDPAKLAGSIAARASWSRGSARAYGSMGLLTGAEREGLRQRMAQGRAGTLEVIDALALFGDRDARRAAKEIDGEDTALHHLVTLPQPYRRLALDGRDALKANAAILKPAENKEEDAIAETTAGLQQALLAYPQSERAAVLQNAEHIAAGVLSKRGAPMTPERWIDAVEMAMGATGVGKERRGGLARWQGRYFAVPEHVTAQEFSDRVFRFVAQNPQQGPRNPDGSPASLRNAVPVMVGQNIYEFHVGNRAVLGKGRDGKITAAWRFEVRKP